MTGIFFGSTTGNTENAANEIAAFLGIDSADIHNVGQSSADDTDAYDTLLLGSSTWGSGDLQDDWYDFLDALKAKDLSGKRVGLFGCGDRDSYPDTFCGALREIYDALQGTGCTFIGACEPEDGDDTDAPSCVDGKFVGLTLSEGDGDDQNAARIQHWCDLVK